MIEPGLGIPVALLDIGFYGIIEHVVQTSPDKDADLRCAIPPFTLVRDSAGFVILC
jgi:hypothetical protein